MVELIETLAITVILFLIARASLQPFTVQGQSMEPTLHNHEFILVEKVTYWFHGPQRGDIVVFKYPDDPTQDYIKRVIGLPGDHVVIQNGGVYVNGARLSEKYIAAPPDYAGCTYCDVVVPKGDLYVLGDNRDNSSDSHEWGLLPRGNVIGRAILAYWPLPDLTILQDPNYPNVPKPGAAPTSTSSGKAAASAPTTLITAPTTLLPGRQPAREPAGVNPGSGANANNP
ncbi:MAG TPA: signal peptidase I [Chloroflexota bacterium]|nr:signal peptidase I [Chloroflexota bacterium]